MSGYYSLTNWDIVGPPRFVGFENYHRLFTVDTRFWRIMYNTFFYTGLQVPLALFLSFFIATLLNADIAAKRFFRGVVYIPSVLPLIVLALVFLEFFKPNTGFINQSLAIFGIQGPNWLQSTVWVKPALILMSMWRIGLGVVLLLAAMRGVPKELYEMAELEGASRRQANIKITLPLISPVMFYLLITGFINALKTFTEVYVLTGGGPNYASQLIVPYIIQNAFDFFRFGYANAISWVLFLVVALFTFVVIRRTEAFVYYESEVKRKKKNTNRRETK